MKTKGNMVVLLEKPNKRMVKNIKFKKNVKNIQEAKKIFEDIRDINCWGASAYQFFTTGIILFNDTPIAKISYNGRVWDVFNKDLNDWESHEEIEEKDFENFIEQKKRAS